MENVFGLFVVIFALFIGGLLGYDTGKSAERKALIECEKTLPRNVQCTIIGVPVDKN